MAYRTTLMALVAGAGAWLAIVAAPAAAVGGGMPPGGCGCHPKPPPPPPPPCNCHPNNNNQTVNVNVNVVTKVNNTLNVQNQVSNVVNAFASSQASANANAVNAFVATQTQAQVVGGGSGAASFISPGSVTAVNLGVGSEEKEAFESERTKIEKVVIEAFCFDDREVPHPASQVFPTREVEERYAGEVYRCIAGTHMQVTIAQFREKISFEGGQTLACQKGEALYHIPGKDAGRLECRPQKAARDCNERSLLRRFGAGIKILTMTLVETYTAYREESESSTVSSMSLDGGVGGIVY